MRVYEIAAPGRIAPAARPIPKLGVADILLRTESVSICSTDVSYFRGHLSSNQWPIVPGHELVGTVCDMAPALRGRFEVGQRVAYWGQTDFDGLAEYRCVTPVGTTDGARDSWFTDRGFHDDHGAAVAILPAGIESEYLSLAEPLTSVMRAVYWTPPSPGDRCLVLGAGPSGLLALQVLQRLFPVSRVEVTDANPFRVGVAEALGANGAILADRTGADMLVDRAASKHGDEVDYVFDALPHVELTCDPHGPSAIRSLAKGLLRPGGRYVIYGATTLPQHIDTWAILSKGLIVSSAPFDVRLFPMTKSASVIEHAVRCIGNATIDVRPLVTHRAAFDDEDAIEDAFTRYGERDDLKTIIKF